MTTCPYCNSTLIEKWKDRTYFKCPGCKLQVRNLSMDQESLDKLYRNSWNDPFQEVSETGGTTPGLASAYADFLLKSLSITGYQGLKILDFGAGRGAMTFALQKAGADVYAVEPYGYDYLKAQGVKVYRDLDEIPESLLFDGVVCLDVIEHLPFPWDMLNEIKKVIAPGGWIFTTTPNSKGLNARVYGSQWREARREGHLLLFSPETLQSVFTNAGYQNIKRLHWNVPYSHSWLVRSKDWLLNVLRLDGELRYLAYKRENSETK